MKASVSCSQRDYGSFYAPNQVYFESNSGEKYNLFGEGGGEALSEKFGLPLLAKIPISEDGNK